MYKKKRRLPKILNEQELNIFFDACDNYMYKTIFMLIYGSGLRISEATYLRVEEGVPLVQIKELLGHSCIRSTMTYVHVANNIQKVDSPLDIFLKKGDAK
jgi:integrase